MNRPLAPTVDPLGVASTVHGKRSVPQLETKTAALTMAAAPHAINTYYMGWTRSQRSLKEMLS